MLAVSTLVAIAVLFGNSHASAPDGSGPTALDGNAVVARAVLPGPTSGGTAQSRGTAAVFDDEAEFLAVAGPLAKENFEDNFTTAGCDSGALTVIPFNHFTATSDIPALKLLEQDCFGNHNTTADGRKYLGADTDVAGVSAAVTFDFVQPLRALGLFVVDLDFANLEVTVNGMSYPVLQNGDGGVSYFGLVSPDPFTSVSFHIVTAFDPHYSFDDLAYGPPLGVVGVEPPWDEGRGWGRVKADYRR